MSLPPAPPRVSTSNPIRNRPPAIAVAPPPSSHRPRAPAAAPAMTHQGTSGFCISGMWDLTLALLSHTIWRDFNLLRLLTPLPPAGGTPADQRGNCRAGDYRP